jgi:Protein of unknown function (DUF4239)
MRFLTTWPLWLSGTLLIGAAALLGMAAPVIVRRRVTSDRLRINNEVAGFTFATVGVLYAVLLAFAVIIVWEKFSQAEIAAAQEAGAAATLYRLANGIEGDPGMALRDSITRYVRSAVAEDWPAMEHSGSSHAVTRTLDATYAALLTFTPGDGRGTALLTEALRQLDLLTEARRTRLVLASGAVPGVLWFVLFGGAIVTVGFTLFFGAENLRVQAMMTGILAFLIFSGLHVIIAIDHPFAGSVKVQPEALLAVLEDFGAKAHP